MLTIYGWFTEGFDTSNLKEAETLVDELAGQTGLASNGSTTGGNLHEYD
jgi:hypothetical protein